MEADAARWSGLAEALTAEQRATHAYAARYSGLAQAQRAQEAYAARWSGLAQGSAGHGS